MTGEMRRTTYGDFAAGFVEEPLRSLCDSIGGVQTGPFGSQLHQEDYVAVGTPIITVEHLGENRILHEDLPRVSDADKERLSKYQLAAGDIVFSRVGSVDRRALVTAAEDGWLFSGRCLRVRPDPNRIDSRYLSYFFGLPAFKEHIRAIAVGATMPSLNTSILSDVIVLHPPEIGEQRAIAKILGVLDDKIDLNRRINETLEATARALFKSWFVDCPSSVSKTEGRVPFLAEAELLSGGTPKTDVPGYWNGDIKWASAKDVSQCSGLFLIKTERNITQAGLDNSATQIIPQFATVVVARGATTGRYCMFGEDIAMNQTCYALKSRSGHSFWLNCAFVNLVDSLVHAAHGSVFDTITTRTFEAASTPKADKDLVAKFEAKVAPLFHRILLSSQESQTLSAMRDILLPKLISGELRIKDAERFVAAAV